MNNQNFIENSLVILTKQTLDIFLKQNNGADLIALYTFYYYTAKWQEANQIKCTTSYAARGLHWREDKVRKAKQRLIELGLIENVRLVDKPTGRIKGHYIKMNYVFKQETVGEQLEVHTPKIEGGGGEKPHETGTQSTLSFFQRVEMGGTNALSTNNKNALSTDNKKERVKEKSAGEGKKSGSKKKKEQPSRFVPPTLDEVTEYCVAGGKSINPEQFVSYYTSNGWKVGKSPMKNWKAAVRTWELRNRGMEWNRHIAVNQSYERESNYDLEAYETSSIFDNGDLTAKDLERFLKKPAEPLINGLISG